MLFIYMAREIQGKVKGLKTDQFKKQPEIMEPENTPEEPEKPEETPEETPEEEKEEGSEDQPSD